jgi:hypothetical protein
MHTVAEFRFNGIDIQRRAHAPGYVAAHAENGDCHK